MIFLFGIIDEHLKLLLTFQSCKLYTFFFIRTIVFEFSLVCFLTFSHIQPKMFLGCFLKIIIISNKIQGGS